MKTCRIFMTIDGVLNSEHHLVRYRGGPMPILLLGRADLDYDLIEILNSVGRNTPVDMTLLPTWRFNTTSLKVIRQKFYDVGLGLNIANAISDYSNKEELIIAEAKKFNVNPVILDTDQTEYTLMQDRLIRVSRVSGLRPGHGNQILALAKKEWVPPL